MRHLKARACGTNLVRLRGYRLLKGPGCHKTYPLTRPGWHSSEPTDCGFGLCGISRALARFRFGNPAALFDSCRHHQIQQDLERRILPGTYARLTSLLQVATIVCHVLTGADQGCLDNILQSFRSAVDQGLCSRINNQTKPLHGFSVNKKCMQVVPSGPAR